MRVDDRRRHARLVWMANESRRLSASARRALEAAEEIGISAISCFEVAMLARRERIKFDRDVLIWIHQALALPRIVLIPLAPEISVLAASLDWDHRDPADRMIVASALVHRARVVTKDDRIRGFRAAEAIW